MPALLEAFDANGNVVDRAALDSVPSRKAPGDPVPVFNMTVKAPAYRLYPVLRPPRRRIPGGGRIAVHANRRSASSVDRIPARASAVAGTFHLRCAEPEIPSVPPPTLSRPSISDTQNDTQDWRPTPDWRTLPRDRSEQPGLVRYGGRNCYGNSSLSRPCFSRNQPA